GANLGSGGQYNSKVVVRADIRGGTRCADLRWQPDRFQLPVVVLAEGFVWHREFSAGCCATLPSESFGKCAKTQKTVLRTARSGRPPPRGRIVSCALKTIR